LKTPFIDVEHQDELHTIRVTRPRLKSYSQPPDQDAEHQDELHAIRETRPRLKSFSQPPDHNSSTTSFRLNKGKYHISQ